MQCQWSITVAGPHPGCAEFAPPETFDCPDEATVLVLTEPLYPGDDGVSALCSHHDATEAQDVLDRVVIADLPMRCTGCGEPVWATHADRHAVGGCTFYPPRCTGAEHAPCSCPEEAAMLAAMTAQEIPSS